MIVVIQNKLVLLIVCSFLLTVTLNAQQSQIFLSLQKPATHKFIVPAAQPFSLLQVPDSAKNIPLKNALPVNFYSTHLGAACKIELKMENGIKMPLRIRLGSKDQVDYLEGKYNRHL